MSYALKWSTGYGLLEDSPRLTAYLQRHLARPAFPSNLFSDIIRARREVCRAGPPVSCNRRSLPRTAARGSRYDPPMPKTIAYVGTPGAGSSSSITWLSKHFGVRDGVVREESLVWIDVEHPRAGTLRIQAAPPGTHFGIALADADVIVYLVDTRATRSIEVQVGWAPYFREMLDLAKLVVGRDADPDPPIILQYTYRDAPDARPIDRVDTDLGIERFLVAGALRMPNPAALRFPKRFEASPATGQGLLDVYEAAANAAVDGPFEIPEDSADFAMAMLDKQLGDAIGGALGGPRSLRVRPCAATRLRRTPCSPPRRSRLPPPSSTVRASWTRSLAM